MRSPNKSLKNDDDDDDVKIAQCVYRSKGLEETLVLALVLSSQNLTFVKVTHLTICSSINGQ